MPSAHHVDLQQRSLAWLSSRATRRGVRGATEVRLGDAYVADAAALCSFQSRFQRQVDPGRPPLVTGYYLSVFEVKVSRGDFLATFGSGERHGNRMDPVGHLHWTVAGKGVAGPDDVPPPWGLLVESGRGLSVAKWPIVCDPPEVRVLEVAHEILWARDRSRSRGSFCC